MTQKPTIAVYVPRWLYRHDIGITMFVRGLYRSISESGKYRLLKITPRRCAFRSKEEAQKFVDKHNIKLVIYHGSRVIPAHRNYETGLDYLEACVPFLNPKSVHIADDKFETKRILRKIGIPVLPDIALFTRGELIAAMKENELYAVKPHDAESGNGVKLMRREGDNFSEYLDGKWQPVEVRDTSEGLLIYPDFARWLTVTAVLFTAAVICLFLAVFKATAFILLSILITIFVIRVFPKIDHHYTYKPLMLEPFFGDGMKEFYCLRCTVIDGKVVESAKKAHAKNITPNISHGGKATKIQLTEEQEQLAIRATKAVGAAYSGVDLLHAKGQTVVCEVNVGPIGVYCEQTEVDVGKLLAEYAIRKIM